MRFQLLGPLSMSDGRETVVLHPSKPANLLAALLLNAGGIVSVDYLQRMVWGDEQPATARAALQTCVLRLRRLFAKHEVVDTPIEAVPGGYRITADARSLDLVEFRERVRRTREPGLPAQAALGALEGALALWQTGVLANVRSEAIHRDEVPRLLEERLRVVERLCDLRLELGLCGQALVDLWSVTRAHPDHGRFREQLIEALYRTGRQTEALAEYRGFKAYLADGLGVGPSVALQRLEMSILRGEDLGPATEPPARAVLPAAAPAAPAPPPDPPGLPPVPWFTGRAEAVATLRRRLTAEPDDSGTPVAELVCGGPGIGKTALAQQMAHLVRDHYPGGQTLVPMAAPDGSPRGAAEVVDEVAARLGARPEARALLILDDVVDAAQARDVLAAVPRPGVLLTSRLGLAGLVATHGVRVHRLGALPAAEARELLTAVLGAERVADEPGGAAELAEVCGHHPLALVIAAARLGTRPALRLGDCARWLADDPLGRLSLSGHPRMSVVDLFDAALDRLDPALAAAYVALGALDAPGWDAADGAAVLGLPVAECEAVLERLADAGLVEDGPPGPYHPHPLLRLHARLVAGRSGDPPGRSDATGQPPQSSQPPPSSQPNRTSQPRQKV
ncbi:BTAD domain-containing putative transcriptional regulator [Streptomyces sp. WMMC500]|uniref:AfsR/SARP family transcriptional regulator n=1 Tax=Streptomyces sp. WMMC500 TaxID=3015154 RepID=UPI00248BD097|nr:AfsR/SARP family transcriptional regulator [Streptomyces sp. WMMC500]WBB64525.1 BTAD domain-containing putative transcriptional regulator [Streptomyces sp. WMMC500]